MIVVWSDNALRQLTDIFEHIQRDSSRYAIRMVDRITDRTRQFATLPQSGQMVPEYQDENVREVIEGSYRVIYRIEMKRIVVVAVVHGAKLI